MEIMRSAKKSKTALSWNTDTEAPGVFSEEITLHIFGYLEQYVVTASMACKQWFRISRDETLKPTLATALDFDYLYRPFYDNTIQQRLDCRQLNQLDVASRAFIDDHPLVYKHFQCVPAAVPKWLVFAVRYRRWMPAASLMSKKKGKKSHFTDANVYEVFCARMYTCWNNSTLAAHMYYRKKTTTFMDNYLIDFIRRKNPSRHFIIKDLPDIEEILRELFGARVLTNADVHYASMGLTSVVRMIFNSGYTANRKKALLAAIDNDHMDTATEIIKHLKTNYESHNIFVDPSAVKSEEMRVFCQKNGFFDLPVVSNVRKLKGYLYHGLLEAADGVMKENPGLRFHDVLCLYAAVSGREDSLRWLTLNKISMHESVTTVIARANNTKLFNVAVQLGFKVTAAAVSLAIHNNNIEMLDCALSRRHKLSPTDLQIMRFQRAYEIRGCTEHIIVNYPRLLDEIEETKTGTYVETKFNSYLEHKHKSAWSKKCYLENTFNADRLDLIEDADCDIVYKNLSEYNRAQLIEDLPCSQKRL